LTFNDARILVIGDIMLDIYKYGTATRISPEAPVPVVLISKENVAAGGAANVAVNLKSFGCNVKLVGYIGDDYTGNQLKQQLKIHLIGCNNLIFSTAPSISKTRIIANRQHMVRYDDDSTIKTLSHRKRHESTMIEHLKKLSQQQHFDVIVVSDYAKGTVTDKVMKVIRSSFVCPIICDIKPVNSELFCDVFCITPNLAEAKQLVVSDNNETVQDLAHAIKKKFNLKAVIITMSHDGIFLLDQEGQSHIFPAHISINRDDPQMILDVTGAGDTVLSTFAACVANDYNLQQAVKLSNLAAGIVVGKTGTAVCSLKELQDENLRM
jgi:D-beta-D-heptose 7-phosphate kinase/D-beta-D-heptose 1-phosphate adenosyltransferase